MQVCLYFGKDINMKAVIQRAANASVAVDGVTAGEIGRGFLILLGVEDGDTPRDAEVLAAKISGLRIFKDRNDKMNLALCDIGGGALVIFAALALLLSALKELRLARRAIKV